MEGTVAGLVWLSSEELNPQAGKFSVFHKRVNLATSSSEPSAEEIRDGYGSTL